MVAKPDTRLWYQFVFFWSKDDPLGKKARSHFHRHVKGEWLWEHTASASGIIVKVKSSQDAMMLRLYLTRDYTFYAPRYSEGFQDFTTNPPSIFLNGEFRNMTDEEVEAAHRKEVQDLLGEVDETDDWVQYCHETKDTEIVP